MSDEHPTVEKSFWVRAATVWDDFLGKLDSILTDLGVGEDDTGNKKRIDIVNLFFGTDISEHYEEWIRQDET